MPNVEIMDAVMAADFTKQFHIAIQCISALRFRDKDNRIMYQLETKGGGRYELHQVGE